MPRYFVGFSVFIAMLSLFLARPPYKFFVIPAIILLYCFFVYTFAFGNALADQKRFKTFFATMLIDDLSKIITKEEQLKETNIYLMERIGNAPSVKFLQKDYPITKKLIPNDFGKHVFGYTNLAWYNFPAVRHSLQRLSTIRSPGMMRLRVGSSPRPQHFQPTGVDCYAAHSKVNFCP